MYKLLCIKVTNEITEVHHIVVGRSFVFCAYHVHHFNNHTHII